MQYILIAATALFVSAQQFIKKMYTDKTKNPKTFLFSALSSLAAMLVFVVTSGGNFLFSTSVLGYSAAFAAAYAAASVGVVFALKYGSMAITSLIFSYSLIIPTLYGLFFLNENIGILGIVGIITLMLSLFLLNQKGGRQKLNVKWILFMAVAFAGNGMCSTIQKLQQLNSGGAYKNEFMIAALAISAFAMFFFSAFTEKGKTDFKEILKYSVPNGFSNGVTNFLVLVLTGLVSNAVLFPSISAGGIVLSCFAALFVYKEKLSPKQSLGYIIGITSVILLNL